MSISNYIRIHMHIVVIENYIIAYFISVIQQIRVCVFHTSELYSTYICE